MIVFRDCFRPRTGGLRRDRQPAAGAPRERGLPNLVNRAVIYAPETLHDLAKISEINQNVFRQPSPRAMLSVAVNDVGNYLRATRCLAVVVGAPGQPPQMASEFCAPGVEASSGGHIVRLIAQIERATPDALGGLPLEASAAPALKEMGLETVLGRAAYRSGDTGTRWNVDRLLRRTACMEAE